MTQENETALRNFEALVRQLMAAYSKERAAREALQVQLDDCRKLLAEEQARVEQSKQDFENLRRARILEVSGDDVKDARSHLARLERKIDKCIALLNV